MTPQSHLVRAGETVLHRVAQATQLDDPTKARYTMQLLAMGVDRNAATLYVKKTAATIAKERGSTKMQTVRALFRLALCKKKKIE